MGNSFKTTNTDAIQAIQEVNETPFVRNQEKQSSGDCPNDQLSILSYNILADCYKNIFLFSIPYKYLDFNYRSPIILEELRKFSADIICLQEVDHYDDFYKAELQKLGYDVEYKQKNKRKDGCVIGFKKDLFERISYSTLNLDKGHKYINRSEFIRGNIAIIATLKHKASGKVVNVVNTHFFWDPKFEHVKYLQMSVILKHIKHNYNENDIVIWCGDFNSKPHSNTIKYLTEKAPPQLDKEKEEPRCQDKLSVMEEIYRELKHTPTNIKLQNAYFLYGSMLNDKAMTFPEYTHFTEHFKGTIDHVFYSEQHLAVKNLLKIPTEQEISDKALPNWRHPSDHLPLIVQFEFLSVKSKL